jgi:hypothetical protein
MKQESYKPLNSIDKIRIKKVLDYWFDENYNKNNL